MNLNVLSNFKIHSSVLSGSLFPLKTDGFVFWNYFNQVLFLSTGSWASGHTTWGCGGGSWRASCGSGGGEGACGMFAKFAKVTINWVWIADMCSMVCSILAIRVFGLSGWGGGATGGEGACLPLPLPLPRPLPRLPLKFTYDSHIKTQTHLLTIKSIRNIYIYTFQTCIILWDVLLY